MSNSGVCIYSPDKNKDHIETKRSEKKGLFGKTLNYRKGKRRFRNGPGQRFANTIRFRRFCYHENKSVDDDYKEYKKSLVDKYDYMGNRALARSNSKPYYAFPPVFYKTRPVSDVNQKTFLKKPLYNKKRKEFYFPPSSMIPILDSIFEELENPYL